MENEVKKESEVSRVKNMMREALAELEAHITHIEDRISPILKNVPEKALTGGGLPDSRIYNTPLAEDLDSFVRIVDKLSSKVVGIKNRIEL